MLEQAVEKQRKEMKSDEKSGSYRFTHPDGSPFLGVSRHGGRPK